MVVLQLQSSHHNMPKKGGKKKAKVIEEDSDMKILTRMETVHEDTKVVTRFEPKFWGQVYQMIKDHTVPDASTMIMSNKKGIR